MLRVIRASGLRSSTVTSLRFAENGHLVCANFRCTVDDLLRPSPPNMWPDSGGSRGIWPTCYGSSGLAACEVPRLHLFDSWRTDTCTSTNFWWRADDLSVKCPPNMGPDSGGSRGIGPTCYRSSGLAACEVLRLHLFDSRSLVTWTVPTLGGDIGDPSVPSPPKVWPASGGSRGVGPTCYRSSGLAACEVLWLHYFDSRRTDTLTVPTLGAAVEGPSTNPPQNMGPASGGSQDIGPTCYRSSGLAACEVPRPHLFDSRSTDTRTVPTLGDPFAPCLPKHGAGK